MLQPADVQCPYCGENFPVWIDTSQGDHELVEDCTVCCRPIALDVRCEPGEIIDVAISRG
jgi:hypothetical protein